MKRHRWIFTLLQLVAFTFYKEVYGQNAVSCTLINSARTCDTGLVSQRDVITVACTLDKSARTGLPNTAEFSVRSVNDDFMRGCVVPLILCINIPTVDCGCVDNADTYTVYLNRTAKPSFDGANVRLIWGTEMDTIKVEAVRDPASQECALNGQTIPDNSDFSHCNFEIMEGSSVTYSCNSALSPVDTSISYQNISKVGANSVVIDGSQAGEGVYTFSSKICGMPAHSGSCKAVIKE